MSAKPEYSQEYTRHVLSELEYESFKESIESFETFGAKLVVDPVFKEGQVRIRSCRVEYNPREEIEESSVERPTPEAKTRWQQILAVFRQHRFVPV